MLNSRVKVWIVGAQGQVGSAFAKMLDKTEIDVLMTDIEDVDITDSEAVEVYADMNRPDIIINCAGVQGIDYCEENKDYAFKVNAMGARNLSVAARSLRALLVQLSTDDVFDGNANSPYDEFRTPTPVSVYGRSKLAGEEFVKNIAQKHLIIRSSWVYGDGENFVTSTIRNAKEGKPVFAYKNQVSSPTSAEEVAKAMYRLLEEKANGTYHVVCKGTCSRVEFAKKILELAGFDPSLVQEVEEKREIKRPAYAILDNLMLRISDIDIPTDWEKALEKYIKELEK